MAAAGRFDRVFLALLVVSFFLLALRTIGQCEYYPSEQNVLGPAQGWLGHPERFKQKYPPFSAYFYYPVLALHHGTARLSETFPPHLTARVATLLLSCCTLFLFWRFARKVGGRFFALLSAFFLATNHSFFALSQLTHPEALLAFLVVAHFRAALGILETGATGAYVAAAVVAAAAIATKYFALALFLPVAAHCLRARKSGAPLSRGLLSVKLGALLLLTPLACLVFVPHLGQFFEKSYPIVRADGQFMNEGPCCMRLPESGIHRAFLWPALVLLPYCVGLWGYLASLLGMVLPRRASAEARDRNRIESLLLAYVLLVFASTQLMTSYFAPQSFTVLYPALAIFSARFAQDAIRWVASLFPGGQRTIAAAAVSILVLVPTLPGLASVTAFYRTVSTNGNRVRAWLTFAVSSLPTEKSSSGRPASFGGGFDMVVTSEAFEEKFSREPSVVFLTDCFVENVRKRASFDPHCERLERILQSIRAGERYFHVATIAEPAWWGRRFYEGIDPEFSLDTRLYLHRSVYDEDAVRGMMAEFERGYAAGEGRAR